MRITVSQLLGLAYETLAEDAPDGLKKNSTLRHLGRIRGNLDTYGDLCAQLSPPRMSEEGKETLARASNDELWIRKDCGCK